MSLTANSSFQLEGCIPLEQVTGETPNISKYLDFSFYDWIWYRDNPGLVTICLDVGWAYHTALTNLMSYWILTSNGRVISRTTVQRVTNLELGTYEDKQ